MLRKLLISGLLALVVAAPAAAQRTTLMPGVTYEPAVQFTPHGPVAIHVVTAPRPTGLYSLRPVLSNETIEGLERVTAIQRRLAATATMVGVNGDLFAANGRPSGVLIRDGVVDSPPFGDRSSVGIAPEGGLDIRRVEFFGTWKGLGQRRAINDLNQFPGTNGVSLFTSSYGPTTPPGAAGTIQAVIFPFPPATANTDLAGPVTAIVGGAGGTAIPVGGAVLVARGTAAQRLAEEAPVGTTVAIRLILRPEWTGIANAVGGGPVLVRNGGPVFRANEAFTSYQTSQRHPRTAIAQLRDGRIRLVVVDGRRPGYSVGMTNFELAQTLVRLGAVTASGFDAGGSSTLAFDGQLLNRPSDPGGERPTSTSLQLAYYGVYAPAPQPVISPNGDGVDEVQRALTYKVVRPSTVTATLTAPNGNAAFTETLPREPGTYPIAFPPASLDPNVAPAAPAEGRWRLAVTATDDLARTSQTSHTFTVNSTLGFAKVSRRTLVVRVRGRQTIQAGVTLARAARVLATVEATSGVKVATIAVRRAPAGRLLVSWKGTTRGGRAFAYGGLYVIRFRATNELGAVELTTPPFRVIRAVPLPKKTPAPMLLFSLLGGITDALTSVIGDYGLYAVFALMLIDAVFPAASEPVMVYSGAVASGAFAGQDVVLAGQRFEEGAPAYLAMATAGTIGYTLGSLAGWWIGVRGGRPFLERHGRWLHLNEAKLDRAEHWFERWEDWAVFLGRITPVVRSFVSIPAGVFRAPLGRYTVLTLVGSAIWCFALAGAGWALGSQWEDFHHGFRYVDYAIVAALVAGIAYLGWKLVRRRADRVPD